MKNPSVKITFVDYNYGAKYEVTWKQNKNLWRRETFELPNKVPESVAIEIAKALDRDFKNRKLPI